MFEQYLTRFRYSKARICSKNKLLGNTIQVTIGPTQRRNANIEKIKISLKTLD